VLTLTPDEENIFRQMGKIEAIKAVRSRTRLDLVNAKRLVDKWIEQGMHVSDEGAEPSVEDDLRERLSKMAIELHKTRDAFLQQYYDAMRIAQDLSIQADQLPEKDRQTWIKACFAISSALAENLNKDPWNLPEGKS